VNFHPDRMMLDDWSGVPLGLRPDGSMILSYTDLPPLPFPSRIVVGLAFVEIDGWIIAYSGISKGTLSWFSDRAQEWSCDRRGETKTWLAGIVDTLREAILRGYGGNPKPPAAKEGHRRP